MLEALNVLLAATSVFIAGATLVYARRDRQADMRLRAETQRRLVEVDSEVRAQFEATDSEQAEQVYEAAMARRRSLEARYLEARPQKPTSLRGVLFVISFAAWGFVLALSNRQGQSDAHPGNLGIGAAVATVAAASAFGRFRAARQAAAWPIGALWGALLTAALLAVIVCILALDGYTD